jgi:probable rRNA maturation factor
MTARVAVRAPGVSPRLRQALRRAVVRALEMAAPEVIGDVCVVVTDDAGIRDLNQRFRSIDAPTDVLAFPLGDGSLRGQPFGDIVVSVQTARRQARHYGAPLVEELRRLAVHGALHLCGYDHKKRREAARMHALTRRVLRALVA